MILLATAVKNKKYRWHRNITFTLEARLTSNQVRYYEVTNNYESCLSAETVRAMFSNGMIRDRPFLAKENQDFYAVLNRNRKQYREAFAQLKRSKTGFVRTKFKK